MCSKSYKELTQDLSKAVATLRAAQPGTLDGFSAMSKAAMEPGVLSAIDKELMALSIGVAGRCDGCGGNAAAKGDAMARRALRPRGNRRGNSSRRPSCRSDSESAGVGSVAAARTGRRVFGMGPKVPNRRGTIAARR